MIFIQVTQNRNQKKDGHFSDILRLLNNGQKSDLFYAHFEQHFNTTTPRTDLHKCMAFKVVKQINPIGAMKFLRKPAEPMYRGPFNDPKKSTSQTHHGYE